MLPIDLPPVVKRGDPGHPDDHNKLREALDVINRGKTEPADLDPYAKKGDIPDLDPYAKKTDIPDTSGLAPKNNPIFTGNVTTPALKITTGAKTGRVWSAKDDTGAGQWSEAAAVEPVWKPWTITDFPAAGWEIGNGTFTGEYFQYGFEVFCRARIVFGSTSKFGTAALRIPLPLPIKQLAVVAALGDSTNIGYQESADPDAVTYLGEMYVEHGETSARMVAFEMAGAGYQQLAPVTRTVPFTWSAGYEIRIPEFHYLTTTAGDSK